MEILRGRVTARRVMAKTTFINIGSKQAMFPTDKWNIRLGDIVELIGEPMVTRTGEPTLRVGELSYHYSHTGFLELMDRGHLIEKNKIIQSVRNFFLSKDYIEVNIPTLISYSQGCNSKTFNTSDWHNNPLQMRVAHEIGLKMLLVRGYDKIFTIGNCFRNEGVDKIHNPEFLMLEAYQNWVDKNYMLDLTKELLAQFNLNNYVIKDNFPAADFPLAQEKDGIAEVWDLEIDDIEIVTGATEKTTGYSNAPELQSLIDRYGMQPCAGIGIGIDRLIMKILNLSSIQETF